MKVGKKFEEETENEDGDSVYKTRGGAGKIRLRAL